MTTGYVKAATTTVLAKTGRDRDRTNGSMVFLFALWFSLFFGVLVLVTLIVSTVVDGSSRLDSELVTNYSSRLRPEETGFRAGILGTVWVMIATAALAVPLGIAAALHLEEFADERRWWNRLIEVNISNLAAVPSVIFGMLAVAFVAVIGIHQRGLVISGAVALALLILPIIIITTREALRAVPREIRNGSLALGATQWQTAWRQLLPAATPGIATGTILGLSRAVGEAAPLLMIGTSSTVLFDPDGLMSQFTALPLQIYSMTSQPQEEFRAAAAAAIILLLALILALNGLAIHIRNKFHRTW